MGNATAVDALPPMLIAVTLALPTLAIKLAGTAAVNCAELTNVVVSAVPFALAPLKLTVPKFASGSTPPLPDGASAMTSADASFADFSRAETVCVQFCVESVIFSVKAPLPFVVTDADSLSPGFTGLLKFTGNFGYISYQA